MTVPATEPEHICSPPEGWGAVGNIITCQFCGTEFAYAPGPKDTSSWVVTYRSELADRSEEGP